MLDKSNGGLAGSALNLEQWPTVAGQSVVYHCVILSSHSFKKGNLFLCFFSVASV